MARKFIKPIVFFPFVTLLALIIKLLESIIWLKKFFRKKLKPDSYFLSDAFGYHFGMLIIFLLIVNLITSCTYVPTSNYCDLYKPVSLDLDKDTPQTMREVLVNNKVYDKLCVE
jgi:hypothetical protein